MKKDKLGQKLNKFGFREDFNYENRFHLMDVVDGYYISTTDLGLDHSFGFGPPLYYETMIFAVKKNKIDWGDLYCERYTTEEQAKEGHKKAIEFVKNGGLK